MKKKYLIAISILALVVGITAVTLLYPYKPKPPADWKSYSSETIGFSMYYPQPLTLREDTKNDVVFYMWGPTQKGQTEMYDGIIFSVRRISATDGGLAHINAQLEQFKNVGTVTTPLHDERINGRPAKTFSASGLGDFTLIFVPVKNQAILEISYMVPDPTNAGFQETVNTMLSTFTLK